MCEMTHLDHNFVSGRGLSALDFAAAKLVCDEIEREPLIAAAVLHG
jgi:hypothetical protein